MIVKPFKAIRPNIGLVDQIAAHPYDVINTLEAIELVKDNPYSFIHIDKAQVDLARDIDQYDKLVYQKAASNLKEFIEKKWLIQDQKKLLYIYELTMNNNSQIGLVACTSVDEYIEGKIKKHEFTRYEKEIDRINHIDYCDANTSPIFLTYKENKSISNIIESWIVDNEVIYDFTSFYNVKHRVWCINNIETIKSLETLFKDEVESFYIADGHHRSESSVKVALKRRESFSKVDDKDEYNYFLSVLFPANQLEILDYNRVLKVSIPDDFITILSEDFNITNKGFNIYKPSKKNEIAMYMNKQWYLITLKDKHLNQIDLIEQLDVSILQRYILEKHFKIIDVRSDQNIDFIGGIRGLEELVSVVDDNTYTIAFAMYPPSINDLLKVADLGLVMPPKSTWFEPKLLSGLFIHDLESK